MADELKKFVEENREDFEMFQTDLEMGWAGIQAGLQPQKQRFKVTKAFTWAWRVAAMLVLGVGLAWWIGSKQETTHFATAELQEAENFYGQQIEQKLQIIQTRHGNKVDPALFRDLAALDSAAKELKKDLKDDASNTEVINAMIQHHRIKLQLLESILEELEKNESKNENKTRHISL